MRTLRKLKKSNSFV
jgi:hypothetical protein